MPVPARLRDVRFRYPKADHDALGPVSLTVQPGEHLAVTGANGSGKTTLMLVLAGREPTSGTVERPGAVGLGRLGRHRRDHAAPRKPGARYAGGRRRRLGAAARQRAPTCTGCWTRSGLDGLAERDTGGLSGGELQRLAVAAALAREPSLLIADEVTSMVDQQGRDALMDVLSGLTRHHRMSLVHITHYNDEADAADRAVNLTGGGAADNTAMVETAAAPAPTAAMAHHSDAPVLELVGVSHEYGSGTPWATTALRDINFVVHEGDGVLIHGLNGSGKSTLAWIMAGLTVPTDRQLPAGRRSRSRDQVGARGHLLPGGPAAVDAQPGRPGDRFGGRVLRSRTVRGWRRRWPPSGLDPALATRRIDQLSGGQMRRVVLAGLLARSPRALDPRRAARRTRRRQSARAAAAAGGSAPPRRADRRRDLARLLRAGRAVPAHPAPGGRRARAGADRCRRDVMTAPTRRQRKPVVLLRPVPGRSVIHELWAGTKLIVVAGIGVLLTFYPGWVPIGAGGRRWC